MDNSSFRINQPIFPIQPPCSELLNLPDSDIFYLTRHLDTKWRCFCSGHKFRALWDLAVARASEVAIAPPCFRQNGCCWHQAAAFSELHPNRGWFNAPRRNKFMKTQQVLGCLQSQASRTGEAGVPEIGLSRAAAMCGGFCRGLALPSLGQKEIQQTEAALG